MISLSLGFDYGNAETCGYLVENGNKRTKVMPSSISTGSLVDLSEKRGASGDVYYRPVDSLKTDEYVIEFGGAEYFVGNLALQESRTASTGRGDVNRYWSQKALAMLLAISGSMIGNTEYELFVVTGLPVETFTQENRQKVKEALDGDHIYKLNGHERRAVIHVMRVVMEGAGSLIAYGKNENVLQGVIDIGGRTTDLYAAEGQKAIAEMCKGKPLGVESIADSLSVKFNAFYGRQLKASETRKLLRAYLGVEDFPTLQAFGKVAGEERVRAWIKTSVEEIANEIISFLSMAWNSSERGAVAADIAPVLLIGGGAYYFARSIKNRVPHVVVPMRPETANAEGYTALANVLMQKELRIRAGVSVV